MGVGQIQKNISILTTLSEAIRIIDKRRNKTVAIVYPASSASSILTLAGKYKTSVGDTTDLKNAKELAMMMAMGEKYGLSD
jgi:CheY-specific phosphatase CheX